MVHYLNIKYPLPVFPFSIADVLIRFTGVEVRVNFWDLSGHAEFFEIRNEFYKDAQGCLLVFDVTSRESFEECDVWLAEAAKVKLQSIHRRTQGLCLLCFGPLSFL